MLSDGDSESILPIIVGTKFGSNSDNEVSQQEVMEAETNWNIPIIKVRHAGLAQGQGAPSSLPEVATALNTICEQLWLAKHRDQLEHSHHQGATRWSGLQYG